MKSTKKAIIERELALDKSVIDIRETFNISEAYIYKVKRNMNSLAGVIKPELIDVTSIVKAEPLNELFINGLNVKCSDTVLHKIFKDL